MASHNPEVALQQRDKARALELGLSGDASAGPELCKLAKSRYPEVRRLAASALGKIANAPPTALVVPTLFSLATQDERPQIRQYALKSLARYPRELLLILDDLKDLARDPTQKEYVRTAAAEAVAAAQKANRERLAAKNHWCARCRRIITEEEYFAGMERYGRGYCRHCLDEKLLEDRNFESVVDQAKRLRTTDGIAVQSHGEKRIAAYLTAKDIAFTYDERYRIAGDARLRPDFYLPEFDLYIEYWGMNTPDYERNKLRKRILYQRAGKRLISLSFADADRLEQTLEAKLSKYIRLGPDTEGGR